MAKKTIVLLTGNSHQERLASGIFSPGHLIKKDANDAVLKHATEGGYAALYFAKENALVGATVSTAYAVGDLVPYHVAQRGDIVSAILKAGVAYAVGDQLISAGDGTLKKASAAGTGVTVKQIIGTVETALDLSATGAVATLGSVEIL